ASPAATYVKAAKKCGVPVQITMGNKGPVPATSMLSVLGQGAHCGDTVVLSAEGEGAEAALDALVAVLAEAQ
ncbi:HPr family phosphocarrier protein, partial [Mycobacterium tuberculosis]|nr:HPr family phosphocarrier protein [Mycobacterium tuberculosis]